MASTMKIRNLLWAGGFAALGFYGMFGFWPEFGNTPEFESTGLWLSGIGWGLAAIIVLWELWKTLGMGMGRFVNKGTASIRTRAWKSRKSDKSDQAYDELQKYKAMADAGAITSSEYERRASVLKHKITNVAV